MNNSPTLSISIEDPRKFITEIIAKYDIKKEIDEFNMEIKQSDTDESSKYLTKKRQPKYFTWCNCHQLQSYVDIKPQQCFNRLHIIPKKYKHNPHDLTRDIKNRTIASTTNM
jgi:hypothetical protein